MTDTTAAPAVNCPRRNGRLGRNERREVAEMTSSAAASSSQAGFRKQDGDPARRVAGVQNAHI